MSTRLEYIRIVPLQKMIINLMLFSVMNECLLVVNQEYVIVVCLL